jgi:hypothetical protein
LTQYFKHLGGVRGDPPGLQDLSWLLTKSRLQNTNLPAKLNNFSPSAALD